MSVIFLVAKAISLILMVFWEIQELLEVFLEVMVLLTTLFLLFMIYLMIFLMVKLTFPSVLVWICSKTICFTTSTLEATIILFCTDLQTRSEEHTSELQS